MAKLMITVLFLCLLLVPQAMPVLATPPDSMVTSNGGEQSHRAYEHIPSPRLPLLLHLIIPVASGRRGGWPSCSPPMLKPARLLTSSLKDVAFLLHVCLHLIIPVASGRRGGWPSCSPPMHPPFTAQACSLPHLKLACSPQACSLAHLKPEGCCRSTPPNH
jgi:hypothetical protein